MRIVRLCSLAALCACAAPPAVRIVPPPVVAASPQRPTAPPPASPPVGAGPDLELLRALAQTRGFHLGTPQHATVTPDGKAVLFLRSAARDPKQSLYEMDVASGNVRELASPDALHGGAETLSPEERVRRERMRVRTTGFTSLELTDDGSAALVTLAGRPIVVERASGKVRELPVGPGAAIDPHFSRDGKRVGYVREDDLYAISLATGREVRLTRGGTERVTHGLAEFIAEEELDRTRGFWWSPDGSRLLFEEADTTDVDVLSIADPAHPDQAPQRIAYPRPGRPNASLRFGIVASNGGGPTTWVQWDRSRFPYVAQASWPDGGPPLLFVLDRLQKVGQLLAVDAATGKTKALVEERDAAWINVDPSEPRWLRDGSGFLWSTERSGEWQLELHDPGGALVRTLLPSGFGYVRLADVDEKTRSVVVVASDDPTQAFPWIVTLDGSAPPRQLGEGRGVESVAFGRAHDRYVGCEVSIAEAPRWFVRSLDGAVAREIPVAAEWPRLPAVEITEVGAERVRVAIVRPHGFRSDWRYPVIDAAYGGPGVTVVEQRGLDFVRAQWMADATQAVVVAIDARGTPRRGRAWERALYGKLGAVPLEGHVAAIEALGAKYRELDLSRVGVYGWSFGGYFAALAVLVRPDVYKAGVAGAPPADWRDYDTAYTERYLGLPADNAAGYDDASLLTYARKPAGTPAQARPLLVVHGTADDNVWFLNGTKLADALERGGRPFGFLPLAGVTHMPLDPELNEALWLRTASLLRDALGATRPQDRGP